MIGTTRHQSARELRDELDTIRRGRRREGSRGSRAAPSIAVLQFANLSPDPENEYFADGITEEVINTLGQIKTLRVAARIRRRSPPAVRPVERRGPTRSIGGLNEGPKMVELWS